MTDPHPPRSSRRRVAAIAALLALAAAAAGTWALRPARAQEAARTLWITGLRIDGTKSRALVRLTNAGTTGADVFAVHYTVQAVNAGEPLSTVAAGPTGAYLGRGDTLDLDLGAIVAAYRKSLGVPGFAGPVRFVAFADAGGRPFGPDVIQVSAVQTEGTARWEPPVEWR